MCIAMYSSSVKKPTLLTHTFHTVLVTFGQDVFNQREATRFPLYVSQLHCQGLGGLS